MLLQRSWLFPVFANNQSGQSPIDPLKLCSLSLNLLERSPRHYGPMQVDFFLFRYYYMTHEYSQNISQVFLYESKLLTTIIGKAIPFSNYLLEWASSVLLLPNFLPNLGLFVRMKPFSFSAVHYSIRFYCILLLSHKLNEWTEFVVLCRKSSVFDYFAHNNKKTLSAFTKKW